MRQYRKASAPTIRPTRSARPRRSPSVRRARNAAPWNRQISVTVTPTITADGRVYLNIALKKDEIEGLVETGAGEVPQINKREITTSVLLNVAWLLDLAERLDTGDMMIGLWLPSYLTWFCVGITMAFCHAAQASTPVSTTLVGMGVPSKYLTLPDSSPASCSAVTL